MHETKKQEVLLAG